MEINVEKALKNLDVDPRRGRIRAIQAVGESIANAKDPHSFANSVIKSFGGEEQADFPTARLIAKSLVDQAVSGDKFVVETAMANAYDRVKKIHTDHPWLRASDNSETLSLVPASTSKKSKGRKSAVLGDGASKKDAARKIFEDNPGMLCGELAKLIASTLKITYANAYFYADRVFKAPKGGKKGRQKKVVEAA